MNEKTILILGGTGKTGRRVAQRLVGRPVRIGGRPSFDWERPDTWADNLHDVGAVYIAYPPDLAVPSAAPHLRAFCALAVARGVTRIVLLSGRNEEETVPAERAVIESGAEYTILRCGWFAQNFDEGILADAIVGGELAFPAGQMREPFVDLEDVADVAALALTEPGHAGKTYELTGPRLLDFAEVTREIGAVLGKPVRYVPISKADWVAGLSAVMPAEEAGFLGDLFEKILDGRNAHTSDDVPRLLGRPARDFRDYAKSAFS